MPHLHRSPLALAAALSLTLVAAPAWSQAAAGNPVNGKALFEDTSAASGNNTIGSCTNCHSSVQERRAKISGNTALSPAMSYETTISRLGAAIGNVGGMAQFKVLSGEDIADLAAYIADTPKASATSLTFTATAVNTMSAAQSVRITAPVAGNGALRITSIAIAGTGAAKFSRTYSCDNKTFAAAESCDIGVTFSPNDTAAANPVLTVTMNEGASTTAITRSIRPYSAAWTAASVVARGRIEYVPPFDQLRAGVVCAGIAMSTRPSCNCRAPSSIACSEEAHAELIATYGPFRPKALLNRSVK